MINVVLNMKDKIDPLIGDICLLPQWISIEMRPEIGIGKGKEFGNKDRLVKCKRTLKPRIGNWDQGASQGSQRGSWSSPSINQMFISTMIRNVLIEIAPL